MALDDIALTAKVKAALAQAEDVSAMDINVDVHDGIVDLKGNVSRHAHDRAIQVTKSVDGVRDILDHLNISSMS